MDAGTGLFHLQGLEGTPTGQYYVGLGLHRRASVFEVEDADGRDQGEVPTRLGEFSSRRVEEAALDADYANAERGEARTSRIQSVNPISATAAGNLVPQEPSFPSWTSPVRPRSPA